MYVRNKTQALLTRAIFLRSNIDGALAELHLLSRAPQTETEYLGLATRVIAEFLRTSRFFELTGEKSRSAKSMATPMAVTDPAEMASTSVGPGCRASALLRARRCQIHSAWTEGRRAPLPGGEDFGVLVRLEAAVIEHVEQLRSIQMQNLVSQAELKALQSQINPHFLFNSLNTLYGTIDRSNTEARRLVLNLADVFRYLLQRRQRLHRD